MKRLAKYAVVVMATVVLALLLWQFRLAIILFFIAAFVAAALRPVAVRLKSWGVPDVVAHFISHLALIAGGVAIVVLVSDPFIREIQALTNDVTVWYEVTYVEWESGEMWQQMLTGYLSPPTQIVGELMSGQRSDLLTTALSLSRGGLAIAAGIAIILAASLYWSRSQTRFERLWMSLLPAAQRGRARRSWRRIESTVGAYLRSEGIQLVLALFLLGAGYALLGLPYPLILAILGSTVWLIPIAGPLLIVLPVLVATVQVGSVASVIAVIYTIGVVVLLEFMVEPRFFDRRKYSPFLVVFGIVVSATLFGPLGLVVGPLLALTFQAVVREYVSRQWDRKDDALEIDGLRRRYEMLLEQVEWQEDANGERELESIVRRLGNILDGAAALGNSGKK